MSQKLNPAQAQFTPRHTAPPRVVIEGVSPSLDAGRFALKRVVGQDVTVSADIFTEGHDLLFAVTKSRPLGQSHWNENDLEALGNDRWSGRFVVTSVGWWEYTLEAWVDTFATWAVEISKKNAAGQDVSIELLEGVRLLQAAAARALASEAKPLKELAAFLESQAPVEQRISAALDETLRRKMSRLADRSTATTLEPVLRIQVERERALFGAWYELFPRSTSTQPGRAGTFRDLEARLPYIASMGFDVVYLPPIHPIGRSFRKGPNNSLTAQENDPGSPWAIGAAEGGHTAILPELGTFEDFARLVQAAKSQNLELALDIAFQCSPDHPWVREHPSWFRQRPDGTIKYAENPPKKYQDIYPLNFESTDWRALWNALRDVFLFWVERGVSIFRVDNPHTKAFAFWEWCLREVWDRHPDAIFLSEAFTRPKVKKYLAKLGFTQSYTYFTWRNHKQGLIDYFTELTQTECAEYLRPNLFVNTPDILHEFLQTGGRPAFASRLILAATLGASYGIYGPPFELCVASPVAHGSEEYLDSEKYQVRHWDLDAPYSLRHLITRINAIRRENPALHFNNNLRFYNTDNSQLLCFGKRSPDGPNRIVTVVNLDPHNTQSGWLMLPLEELGIRTASDGSFPVHDLLDDARYTWRGPWNFVVLDPHKCPAHVFRIDA
jgi:starch synthase (maltosyl-transferring)